MVSDLLLATDVAKQTAEVKKRVASDWWLVEASH
jgi:hypothetical protein